MNNNLTNNNVIINPNDLLEAANEIIVQSDNVSTYLKEIQNSISTINENWIDTNAKNFNDKFNTLAKSFDSLKINIEGFGTFLKEVVRIYNEEYNNPTSNSINNN